jgi:hypothetical protein
MKRKLFFVFAITICCSFMSKPFLYYFSMVDPTTGRDAGKPEKTTAVYQKPKGKVTTNDYIISGAKSSKRLKIAEAIFNATSDDATATLDPSLYISLYKVSSGKTSRTFSMTPEGGGVMWLPVNISKPDGYTIRIIPGVAMVPGEYVIVDRTTVTSEGNYTVWAFGID